MARSSFHYLKWNFLFEVQFTSVIRGHKIYKSVWTPTLGEKLNCREDDRKEAKQHHEYAIGTYLEAFFGSLYRHRIYSIKRPISNKRPPWR